MKKISEIKKSDTFLASHITQGGFLYIPTCVKNPVVMFQAAYGLPGEYLMLMDKKEDDNEWQEYLYIGEALVRHLFNKLPKTSRPILMEEITPPEAGAEKAWRWLMPQEVRNGE